MRKVCEVYHSNLQALRGKTAFHLRFPKKLHSCIRGRNNGRSTDMATQILPSLRPEFSVIIEVTDYFFSRTTEKELTSKRYFTPKISSKL